MPEHEFLRPKGAKKTKAYQTNTATSQHLLVGLPRRTFWLGHHSTFQNAIFISFIQTYFPKYEFYKNVSLKTHSKFDKQEK